MKLFRRIKCFFGKHQKVDRKCVVCGCEFGVHKMPNHPPVPIVVAIDYLEDEWFMIDYKRK